MSQPTLIVFGNCQAEWVSLALAIVPEVADRFEIHYVYSFVMPVEGPATADPDVLARCVLLLEQRGAWARFPWRDALPPSAETVTFPALTMDALWPLTTFSDPRNVPVLPHYPFGRFPYGDRLIADWIAGGLSREETLARYLAWPLRETEDLERVMEVGTTRLEMTDAECDVQMAERVLSRFRDEPLFFTCNHARPALLSALVDGVLQKTGMAAGAFGTASRIVSELFEAKKPNDNIQVPVHPHVAEALDLKWYRPDLVYCCYESRGLSYQDYWREYVRY